MFYSTKAFAPQKPTHDDECPRVLRIIGVRTATRMIAVLFMCFYFLLICFYFATSSDKTQLKTKHLESSVDVFAWLFNGLITGIVCSAIVSSLLLFVETFIGNESNLTPKEEKKARLQSHDYFYITSLPFLIAEIIVTTCYLISIFGYYNSNDETIETTTTHSTVIPTSSTVKESPCDQLLAAIRFFCLAIVHLKCLAIVRRDRDYVQKKLSPVLPIQRPFQQLPTTAKRPLIRPTHLAL
ncbi:hypothetical protein M3Y94_01274400 [Aphelenchoides besseyi]|nr:hypothetical protein M3Y94_01274400 [Aphelenchoides besseyi]KAI6222665.1 hypothetical protein M3Y95_00917600 [Aphelenchoides besseyi]